MRRVGCTTRQRGAVDQSLGQDGSNRVGEILLSECPL